MWVFLANPPAQKGGKKVSKKKGKSGPTKAEARKYKSLVKKLGVQKAAKEYRKWKRETKRGTGSKAKATTKGGKRMAKTKGRPTSARGRKYRSLVKKHGVQDAARIWRSMPESKKGGKRAANPPKKKAKSRKKAPARRGSYKALVKKHGVQEAARIWRSMPAGRKTKKAAKKRTYTRKTGGQWRGDKAGHSIASTAGWARRKGIPVPLYLSQRGFSQAEISRFIKKHGPIGESHRPYTRSYPVPAGRRYAMNPVEDAVATVKGTFAMDSLMTAGLVVLPGFMGMAIGNAVVRKLKADAGTPLIMAGEFGGSLVAGVVSAMAHKSVEKGILTAGSGIALSVFKFAWNKFMPKTILGLELPTFSDYVELPYTEDYVELPYASGMGQSLYTGAEGIGQFLPPEAAQVSQFIPEQFGEYSVGIGEEAEVEY